MNTQQFPKEYFDQFVTKDHLAQVVKDLMADFRQIVHEISEEMRERWDNANKRIDKHKSETMLKQELYDNRIEKLEEEIAIIKTLKEKVKAKKTK